MEPQSLIFHLNACKKLHVIQMYMQPSTFCKSVLNPYTQRPKNILVLELQGWKRSKWRHRWRHGPFPEDFLSSRNHLVQRVYWNTNIRWIWFYVAIHFTIHWNKSKPKTVSGRPKFGPFFWTVWLWPSKKYLKPI